MAPKIRRTGFKSPQQEANFYAARENVMIGRPGRATCGAKTRGGGPCQSVTISGHNRCLRHAGPKAANAFYERKRAKFLKGQIPWSVWQAYEARRAVNRMRSTWKRFPWQHGQTLALGPLEESLTAILRARGIDPFTLPPSVLDWLRWRYRRFQIDRRDDAKWRDALHFTLPDKIRRAGPMPPGWEPDISGMAIVPGLELVGGVVPDRVSPKRSMGDIPRAPSDGSRKRLDLNRMRLPTVDEEDEEEANFRAKVAVENRKLLAHLYGQCNSEHEREVVLATLVELVRDPENTARWKAWQRLVLALQPPLKHPPLLYR